MKPAFALLRTLLGALFIGHGAQKLFGAFGGGGPEGTGQFFEQSGLKPGKINAYAAGAGETAGGLLFLLDRAVPLGGVLMSGVMWTAIWAVHKDKGPWVTEGGWEYPAVLLAALTSVTEQEHGTATAFGQLAAGAAGAAGVIALSADGGAGGGPQEAATGSTSTQEG